MAISLKELLDKIPPETENKVEQTRTRFNRVVRQILRAETGLRLSNLVTGDKGEERETLAIKVFVTPGMPEELKQISFDDDLWLAIELAPLKRILETAHRSMIELCGPIEHLEKRREFDEQFPNALNTVWGAHDLVRNLLEEAAKFDLLTKIFGINKDVMGLYSYYLPPAALLAEDSLPPKARTDLYWAVIGFISKILGITIEGLAVKVLAHELSHAYTHIGADHDGKRWNSHAFLNSELALKEGLAQYYTARVVYQLESQLPEAKEAYEKLLPHQPLAYSTHLPWLENFTPEEVRNAMVETRRGGVGTVEIFEKALQEAGRRLRK